MGALADFSIKQKDGSYKNYTISISDQTNDYGQNVSVYESQTKEEVKAKAKKKYIGNGKVFWTDGKVVLAEKKDKVATATSTDANDDLPF
jgi:hypothetical protein